MAEEKQFKISTFEKHYSREVWMFQEYLRRTLNLAGGWGDGREISSEESDINTEADM